MRHYYDSRMFPFLSDILFDQLLNFDWESSRKEIEEEKKKTEKNLSRLEEFCKKGKKDGRYCNYLQTEEDLNKDLKVYTPEFELEDGVYTYKANIGKGVKPEDVKISASEGTFCLTYSCKTETGAWSATSIDTLPEDLDTDTLKAVLKNGVLTVTADQLLKVEEVVEPEKDDDIEYEIEIGK
jgi:HSP20 family molecular chaperone IbpA